MTLRSVSRTCGGRQRAKGPLDHFATAYRVPARRPPPLRRRRVLECAVGTSRPGRQLIAKCGAWAGVCGSRRRIAARVRGALYSAHSRGLPKHGEYGKGHAHLGSSVRCIGYGMPHGRAARQGRAPHQDVWGRDKARAIGYHRETLHGWPLLPGTLFAGGRLPTKCCGGSGGKRWSRASSRSNAPTTPTGG